MVLSWETLQRFNLACPPTFNLGREKDTQDKYDIHRTWLKNSGIDVKSYIYEKFNLLENGIIFIENEFPYNCARGITHYVVWISDRYPYNIDKLESFITKSIHEKDPSGEYVFYKNIPQNNSISCVNHYHVFVKFS
jgi:hypothetical protein